MLALGLTCSSAVAEWTMVNSDEVADDYVNSDNLRRVGDMVKMWNMSDYKSLQKGSGAIPYKSSISLYEYNCKEIQKRWLSFTSYKNKGAKGVVVSNESYVGQWVEIVPDTISETLWKTACGKH